MERLHERKANDAPRNRCPPSGKFAAWRTAAALPARESGEQALEVDVFEAAAALGELLAPIGRRAEILARRVAAELIVRGALLRVLERLVGLRHFLELLLGVLFLRHVGVILARELAIGGLDLVGGRVFLHAENRVVVLVLHQGFLCPVRVATL